jgi:hypothetical protein
MARLLLDPGYTGLDEMIFFEQIVGIEEGPGAVD